MPSSITIAGAVVLAFPFGWGLGVLAAYLIAGSDFGQLPAATVPIAIVASIAFALWPALKASTRLTVMLVGTALFVLLARLVS